MIDEQVKTVRIVIDASKAREGGAAVEAALKSIDDKIASLGDSIGSSFSGIKNAILGFFTFDAALAQIRGLTEAFDRLGSRARTLGEFVEWMQAFEFAAANSSVKLDAANGALEKWARTVGEADLGSKGAVDTLNRLGVQIYDADHKMRPLSDTFVDAARKLAALDGTAKGSALGVQAMGKEYQRVAPMMGEVAKGSDAMVAAAQKAGAIVTRETVKIWEDLAAAADKSMIKWRSFAGENFADSVKKGFEAVGGVIASTLKELNAFISGLDQLMGLAKSFAREQNASNVRTDSLKPLDEALPVAQDAAAVANRRLASVQRSYEQTPTGAGLNLLNQRREEARQAEARVAEINQKRYDVAGRIINYAVGSPDAPPAVAIPGAPVPAGPTTGAYAATAADPGAADRLNKRLEALQAEAAAQKAMAAAALQGAGAVAEEEAKFKALQQALEVYGDTARATDPKVKGLAATIRQANADIANDKLLIAFRLQTKEIEGQNGIIEKRLELINAAPEIVAREVALLQVRNDLAKTGAQVTDEDLAARTRAVEQQEILNIKLQDAARAQELWLEPIKSGLQNVQSSAANMWEQILSNGRFSLQEFGQLFSQTLKRAAAELLALATIRPVISVAVEGLSSLGLVSPSTVRSLGYGDGGGLPSFGGGGSLGGGGFGGASSLGFFGQPIVPASYGGAAGGYGSIGELISSGSPAGLGGLTWGQGIAGVASIGMGAYSLATSRSTAGTIGGGLGILGGGIGLASAAGLLPMLGAAGGPIGMGVGLLGSLLPMLFGGGGEYKWDPLAGANTRFDPSASGYVQSGTQQLGGRSINGQFAGVGQTLDSFFKAAGGLTDPGRAFGAAVWNNQREGTTSTYEISPTQGSNQLTFDESGDPAAAIDRMIAKVFYNSIQNNAAMNASPTLRTAFANREPTSTAEISGLFDLIKAYDSLGKETTKAETALKQIDESFASLTEGAKAWGLSLTPITAELEKQRKAYAEDFLHTINQVLDPVGTALDDFAKERADGMKEWKYINDNVKGVVIEQARVEEYYAKKEAALKEQLYGGAVSQLEDAIKRLLPGGNLSNLNDGGTLQGLQATFNATYAQAIGGDSAAISRLAGEGTQLGEFAQRYYAGSQGYNDVRDMLLERLGTVQAAVQQPAASGTPLDTTAGASSTADVARLVAIVQKQSQDNADLRADLANMTGLLKRYLGRAA